MIKDIQKSPRVYTGQPLILHEILQLQDSVHHYLKNVLRVQSGDIVRLFNGHDGEFLGRISDAGKKSIFLTLEQKLRDQKDPPRKIHLLFAPIKKERMDFLIEKAVELGVTDLHIILTQNTDVRKINKDRLNAQIIEAAEQCERLDIPTLHDAEDLFKKLGAWNRSAFVLAALERTDATPMRDHREIKGDCAILIGPSGGFTDEEKNGLARMTIVRPVSLGEAILRSETAAAAALALLTL